MAILNKIRQKTVVLILVIALALFAFVLSSLFDNQNALFSKSPNVVATINGKDISRQEFMARVEAQQTPNATTTQIMNQVYEAEVRQAVMGTQFEKLGLNVGRQQMRDLLRANLESSPQFLNEDGVYDESKLNAYIANLKETSPEAYAQWISYEDNVSSGALQQTYFNLVKAGTTATLAEGALEHKLEGDKVDIKFVQVPYTSIADSSIEVSKGDIENYVEKHSKKYEVDASRSLQYVKFEEVASLEDETVLQEELIKLIRGNISYNSETKKNDTVVGFANMSDAKAEVFVNENSDVKFNNGYVYESAIAGALKDSISKLNTGDVYGPYKEGRTFKVAKLVAQTKLPDSVKARHILIPFIGSRAAAPETVQTEEQAKTTSDSLLAIIKTDRSKFVTLLDFSIDKVSNEEEGVLDWYTYNTMTPAFRDYTFENKKGDIGVVKTDFGFHIVEILDQKNEKQAYKLATLVRNIEPSIDTEDTVFREASNFVLKADNNNFQEVAKEKGFPIFPVSGVKVLDENIPGVGNQREIVRWAFEKSRSVGDIKRFSVSTGYVVAQVTAKNQEGLMNVEDASVTAIPAIRKEKKAQLIKERAKTSSIEDFAASEGQTVKTASAINMKNPTIAGAGKEPLVVGTAFGLKEGATSKVIAGEKGVYMVQVTKTTPAVTLDNYQSYSNQVGEQKLNSVNTRLYSALKEAAEIEDNRANTIQ
ncbi:peptidylprolyl isomerase [Bizionia gelidisalsuginis]|uniref:Periplasmic chaperone PpiD n=2 Tax=Bizionia TaxID=283785 RepID=A0A8H2LG88_9FLAO|nr:MULTISPECIES: SurA N-terminal domain-containing protein [Bizionia]TYB78098.1 peptidylprolyl isomerase [Bizionia saleffrena]TYC12124.1 peptidylprolyl isomerase [Bizionia gelidisalsuginis]